MSSPEITHAGSLTAGVDPCTVSGPSDDRAAPSAMVELLLVAGNDNGASNSTHIALERLAHLMARAYVATLSSECL